MKQFVSVAFGGLMVLGMSLGFMRIAPAAWNGAVSLSAAVFSTTSSDGTSISGVRRFMRYTAGEEEDLLSNAAVSVSNPKSPVTAEGYIVKNVITGKTVDSKNSDRLFPIASLTKLVTAEVARRSLNPFATVVISREIMQTYGNTASFKIGEMFTAHDLLYPLLMVSSNDAAEAFAATYGRRQFIAGMNEFAQSVGAYRTYFADPSGLSPDNVSTPSDMAVMLDWIRSHDPELLSITELKSKTVRSHTWVNPTHFLNWSNYLGGKNGYTDEANRTGAALFSMGRSKDTYAIVVLGSESRDADVIKLLEKVKE